MRTQLQEMRKRAGFKSARAFADFFGISIGTYTDYEQGRRNFSFETAWEFADALGCSLDELAGREVPPPAIDDPLKRQVVEAFDSMNMNGRATLASVARSLAGDVVNTSGKNPGMEATLSA